MSASHHLMRSPRFLGIACAIGATALGLIYLFQAGAPAHYLALNAAALGIGGGLLLALRGGWPGLLTLAMGAALLATALFGFSIEGAARWLRAGPVFVQPSLVLLPAMLVAFARAREPVAAAGLIVAALALALQPDRAMAGMLAGSLLVLCLLRAEIPATAAALAALLGLAATLLRPDTLPAVPYVDGILYSAFTLDLSAGLAVTGGACLLLVPAIVGAWQDPENRPLHLVFGTAWLSAILAAALGNYPTPMVGYGGSAVLGYLLSVAVLPRRAGVAAGARAAGTPVAESANAHHAGSPPMGVAAG